MLRFVAVAAAVLLVASSCVSALATPPNAFPPIWPYPQSFVNGTGTVVLDASNLKLLMGGGAAPSKDLTNAFSRFLTNCFSAHVASPPGSMPPGTQTVTAVTVNVLNQNVPLQLGVDESYKLEISVANGIMIHAKTLYGVYHALETASQLVEFDFETQAYRVRHSPWHVTDAPRFAHRSLLMDTARHYLPLKTIFAYIDSMSYAKMNALHWHIVDSQAFPFVPPSHPSLGIKGSWSAAERFSANDVAAVVEYGRARGVRVMIEVDTPGHSAAWCRGKPEICPSPFCPGFSGNINNPALDITKNETYTVVQDVIGDLTRLAPEQLFHIGGDEVDTYCWSQRPAIMQWLNERGMTLQDGFLYYLDRIIKHVTGTLGRTVVGWNEIWNYFGTKLPAGTVIQLWVTNNAEAMMKNITSNGYKAIFNPSQFTYLDHLTTQWTQIYQVEPCKGLTAAECSNVLGMTCSMWGETANTGDALQTIWPRAAALAERSWSGATVLDTSAALPRLLAFKCLLHERGIPSAPVQNLIARAAPPNPGSCFYQ
jgi:hexosaminidase